LPAGPARSNDEPNGSLPPNAFDVPYRQLLALPTNLDALSRVVSRAAGSGSPAWRSHEMFTVIGDLLREDPVPARVRVALYLVAARIPGVRLLGLTRDRIGRPALAVGLNDSFDHLRAELLFDPHTAKLLGESEIILKPDPGSARETGHPLLRGHVPRLGHRRANRSNDPALSGADPAGRARRRDYARSSPPAIAGSTTSVSPGPTAVSRPSSTRTSSSFRYTLT
jgi:hypothetical protein